MSLRAGVAPPTAAAVSVIIAARRLTKELPACLAAIAALDPRPGEVLVVLDALVGEPLPATVLVSSDILPAAKRNLALAHARGEIIAFLDDDVLPIAEWLPAALRHFADPRVGAVGGPGVTPADDPPWAQASGIVYASWLGSGPLRCRFSPVGGVRAVDDWPTMNLLVRRAALPVGGFSTNVWPGEDTKLCLDLAALGWTILYDPAAIVAHRRPRTVRHHLSQIARYGLHRGYFFKRYPETSRRLVYLFPTLLLGGLAFAVLVGAGVPALREVFRGLGLAVLGLLVLFGVVAAIRLRQPLAVLRVPVLLVATHLTYGVAFPRGLFARMLPGDR